MAFCRHCSPGTGSWHFVPSQGTHGQTELEYVWLETVAGKGRPTRFEPGLDKGMVSFRATTLICKITDMHQDQIHKLPCA